MNTANERFEMTVTRPVPSFTTVDAVDGYVELFTKEYTDITLTRMTSDEARNLAQALVDFADMVDNNR